MHYNPINLSLKPFEGPLNLLIQLIQNQALDISSISLEKVTDQYLQYVYLMQDLNFDIASEFLVMAATLLYWKSKALLPTDTPPEAEEEKGLLTQEEIVRRLKLYQFFQNISKTLAGYPLLGIDVFKRQNPEPPSEKVLKPVELTELILAYQNMQIRLRRRFTILKKETVSIADKIKDLEVFSLHEWIAFDELLIRGKTVSEKVATFLAILELCRLKKSHVQQQDTYEMIYLKLLQAIHEFDISFTENFIAKAMT